MATTPNRLKPSRWIVVRKWVGRTWVAARVVVLLALLSGAGYALWVNHRGEQEKEQLLAQLRARQIPTSIQELREKHQIKDPLKDGTRFYRAAAELSDIDGFDKLPVIGVVDSPPPGKPIPPEMDTALAEAVGRQAMLYQLVKEGRSYTQFNYALLPYGIWMLESLAELNKLRHTANWMELKSWHEQALGHGDAALDACEAILDLKRSMEGEPSLVVAMFRSGLTAMATDAVQQVLSRTTPSAEAIVKMQARLARDENGTSLDQAMVGELANFADAMQSPETEQAVREYWLDAWREQLHTPALTRREHLENAGSHVVMAICPGRAQLRIAGDARQALAAVDAQNRPEHVLAAEARANADRTQGDRSIPNATLRLLASRAALRVCAAGLAVERYRIEHGHWPEKLEDVAVTLRLDPFTGNALIYKPADGGRIVYSVGMDLKDGGGKDWNGREGDIAFRLFDPEKRNRP